MVEFKKYHPIISISYFILVFFIIMFTLNPVILIISLISGIIINLISNKKGFTKNIWFYLLVIILIVIINPLVSNQGKTVLVEMKYFDITLEAIIYGITFAVMLISIFIWFGYYNYIMTSDKLIYLFNKTLPSIGLIISMGLKMIPSYQQRLEEIGSVQKSLGYENKKIKQRIQNGVRNLSALITQTLENSIDTADAMKARGYGIGKRTSFSIFRFKKDDYFLSVIIGLMLINLIRMIVMKEMQFAIYPKLSSIPLEPIYLINYLIIFLFYFIPIIIETKESLKWRYLKLKI